MVLAASEDKTYRGGFVASPGRPWAWANVLQSSAVYHAVWSRDLYEIATALIAMGDRAAANRALDYLFDVQQRPDGSYPQNSRLSGVPVFGGLQMDEVSFPTVLAGQLGRTGPADWQHIKKAEDFVVANGPSTPGERWENASGYSPATIAAEIAGLVVGANIARKNGDSSRHTTICSSPTPGAPSSTTGPSQQRSPQQRALLPAHHATAMRTRVPRSSCPTAGR